MKLKLYNISLYKKYVFYCSCSRHYAFVAMANFNFHRLNNGKSESRPLFLSHCRYFDKSFSEMFLASTKHMNFVQTAEFDWLPWHRKYKFGKKIKKSEAIRGMKLKLCRNVHNISLYICFYYYCSCFCAFVAMAILSFHWVIMRKVKVGHYCYLTAKYMYFDKVFLNVCWVAKKLYNKFLILICCHGNWKSKMLN